MPLHSNSPTENVETELYIAEERVHASSALVRVRSEEKEIAFDCGQRDETKDLDKRFNEKSLSVTETKDALFESTSYHKEQSPSRTKAPLPQRPRSSMGPKRQSALRKGAGSRVHGNEEPARIPACLRETSNIFIGSRHDESLSLTFEYFLPTCVHLLIQEEFVIFA